MLRDRIIRFLSAHRVFAILYIYQFTVQAYIRSIVPTLTAVNYRVPFRLYVLALEGWFLLKASYGLVVRKSFLTEKFFCYTMRFTNYLEFVLLFIEMFGIQEYRLHIRKKRPRIVDCGSGWGMSVLYFKHFYPGASITAVEANENTSFLLRENIKINHIRNVVIRTAFVCGREGQHPFYTYKKFGGWSVSDTGATDFVDTHSGFIKTSVLSLPLSTLLRRGVDVVKLDIEGMEGEAIKSAQKELLHVTEVAIEYHPGMNRKHNMLGQIRRVLKNAGMHIAVVNTESLFPKKDALVMIYALRI